jgi:hypothetical protein
MSTTHSIPWFGARKLARALLDEVTGLRRRCEEQHQRLVELGALTIDEIQQRQQQLLAELEAHRHAFKAERDAATNELNGIRTQIEDLRKTLIVTEEKALLQEAGVYEYQHPLSDAVAYQRELDEIQDEIKAMTKRNGGAVLAETNWTVNGSEKEGRTMTREFSTLMLRAFNAEADDLVRSLKPYKLRAAKDRLEKVSATIERLGKTMRIRISTPYLLLRERELELTADFLQKQAEEKEAERRERERLREERKAQQELERERLRLEKERQHYENARDALKKKGDDQGAARLQVQLDDVDKAISDVDYRAANIRAGYVYVISNIGSFGERMVKIGMTRRLDPIDRIRELSDASVPFNFDVHALFFSKDAVGIEQAMHERLSEARVNLVNMRREFFRATPAEVKAHLAALSGELLEFHELAEAIEYRQSLSLSTDARSAFASIVQQMGQTSGRPAARVVELQPRQGV